MTKFQVTPALRAIVQGAQLEQAEKDALLEDYVTHAQLIDFYRKCRPTSSMLALMKLTKMAIPNKMVRNETLPKTQEYLKAMERLRLVEKEDEYRRLVNPRPALGLLYEDKHDDHLTPAQAYKETRSHVTTMFNILISVCSVVYAIWYWTASSWGLRDSYRVLLCVFFGLLILVAEVVVYLSYLNKIEAARQAERSKKEVKTVIRSVVIA